MAFSKITQPREEGKRRRMTWFGFGSKNNNTKRQNDRVSSSDTTSPSKDGDEVISSTRSLQTPLQTQRPMRDKYVSRRTSVAQKRSFHTDPNKMPMGFMQLRNANLHGSLTAGDQVLFDGDDISSILLKGLKKQHLCDTSLIGKDGAAVKAPSFLLCSHSSVFEDMLFGNKKKSKDSDDVNSDSDHFVDAKETIAEGQEAHKDADGKNVVKVSFAAQDAIQKALHFMASHKLLLNVADDSSEANMRTLTQVNVFAMFFKMNYLGDEVYRKIRVLVNKTGNLASVVFDECYKAMKLAGMEDGFKKSELLTFVFDSIREKPEEFLIAGGLQYLSSESIQKIICDQEIDVDEITMFHILFTWVREGPGKREDRLKVAKSLVSNIQLTLLDVKYLNARVRYCGFVDASVVNDAINEIEAHQATLAPEEQEHVVVSGAGTEAVNGIYVRMEEDIGLEGEEAVFIKEASEDKIGGDYGLYLWKDSWAISPCVDYSNVLYIRDADTKRGWDRLKPPADDWETDGGVSPPPTCQWTASAEEIKSKSNYVAPRLTISPATFKMTRISIDASDDINNGDHAGAKEYSLDDMLNLPTDQDFESNDYHEMRPKLHRSETKSSRRILNTKRN